MTLTQIIILWIGINIFVVISAWALSKARRKMEDRHYEELKRKIKNDNKNNGSP